VNAVYVTCRGREEYATPDEEMKNCPLSPLPVKKNDLIVPFLVPSNKKEMILTQLYLKFIFNH
jgi:hypothetical protein